MIRRPIIPLLAILFGAAACSADLAPLPPDRSPPPTSARHVVIMKELHFSPRDITIARGDTIAWINLGAAPHTTTSGINCTSDGLWDSGILNSGGSFAVVFDSAGVDTVGTVPYYCIPHCFAAMEGTVTVEP